MGNVINELMKHYNIDNVSKLIKTILMERVIQIAGEIE
jgi:hypothetical protein